MPTLFKMSDDKRTEDIPSVVYTETQAAAPPRKTKKYVIIAVSGILAVAIILAAILVGMYMFTKAQLDIVQYTMKMGDNGKQDVTSDPNENVVQYHVSGPQHDTWIVNDFNKDIQLLKIVSEGKTNCYLSALNRTNTMDPSKINGPDKTEPKDVVSLVYRVSDTPIADASFLSKTARDMCKGISVYWLYPSCSDGTKNMANNGTDVDHPKSKRQTTYDNSPYWVRTYSYYHSSYDGQWYYVPCYTGCCRKMCACEISISAYYSGGYYHCSWAYKGCDAVPYLWDYNPCKGPSGVPCSSATYNCY
jgi:uncharacterized protein YxeA